jgi:hypothetical protein
MAGLGANVYLIFHLRSVLLLFSIFHSQFFKNSQVVEFTCDCLVVERDYPIHFSPGR